MMINFFPIFCMFLKNYRFCLSFHCKKEFCMQKYLNKHIFIGFAEKSHLLSIFAKPIAWRFFSLSAKKLISTNLAIFGFFPSKRHDSVGIRHFCLRLLEKNTKKIEINDDEYFFFPFFACFSNTIDFGSVFSVEMNSACKNTQISTFFIGFAEKKPFTLPFLKRL